MAPLTHSVLTFAATLSLGAAAACTPETAEPEDSAAADQAVFERTHDTLATVPLLAYVAELFGADPGWHPLDPEVTARLAIAVTQARAELILGSLNCELTVETDGVAYVDAAFSNCLVGDFVFSGSLEANLTVEGGPCPSDEGTVSEDLCSLSLQWDLGRPEFTITDPNDETASRFSGPIIIRDSIVDAEAFMTWETANGFSLQAPGGNQYTTRSTASWLVDPATRCMDISLDARLELTDSDTQQDGDLDVGEIVVSASDVAYCPTHCPTAGYIEMAYGTGSILSWTYDGTDVVVVTGPGGREFTADLPCPAVQE